MAPHKIALSKEPDVAVSTMARYLCLLVLCGVLAASECWTSELWLGDVESLATTEASGFWTAWWNGGDTENYSLFGKRLHFWKRVGKSLLFLAGLSIVVDIIGSAGLRQLGNSLGRMSLFNRTVAEFREAWGYLRAINRATYGKVSDKEANALASKAFKYLARPLNILVTIALAGVVLPFLYTTYRVSWWGFLVAALLCVAISPAATLVASLVISIPGLVFDWIVLKPAARLLEMHEGEKYIRIVMLSSFILGSIIDFVAD